MLNVVVVMVRKTYVIRDSGAGHGIGILVAPGEIFVMVLVILKHQLTPLTNLYIEETGEAVSLVSYCL